MPDETKLEIIEPRIPKDLEDLFELFVSKSKRYEGRADDLFGWAERLQNEALRFAIEEFIGMMEVVPADEVECAKAKRQVCKMMDAITASNMVLYRDADD